MQHLAFRRGAALALAAQVCASTLACRVDGDVLTVANPLSPASPLSPSTSSPPNVPPTDASSANPRSSSIVSQGPVPVAAAGPTTLYLAGDGAVQSREPNPEAPGARSGWGQWLARHIGPDITVDNRAVAGRSARRFIDEGRLDEILSVLLPGDYLLIEFGTTDVDRRGSYQLGDESIPNYLDPATEFKSYLDQYITGAREHRARPVLVTPPTGRSAYCTGSNTTEAQARAIRELGLARSVPVVDLNAQSVAHLAAICPAPQREDFFAPDTEGGSDGGAFRERGARTLAGFVANGLAKIEPGLVSSGR
jgi:lysophospholipase L1-like esterase